VPPATSAMEKSSCQRVGKNPFVVNVSYSPMGYSAAIVAITGCKSLRVCFLTDMEQERFFKCNMYFNQLRF